MSTYFSSSLLSLLVASPHAAAEASTHSLPWLWAIPLLPLIGAILNGFGALTGRLSRGAVNAIACSVVGVAFLVACAAFTQLLGHEGHGPVQLTANAFPWIVAGDFRVDAALLVDQLSGVMILVVTGVGFLIHLYSTGYMSHEPSYARYFAYLNLFTFSMLLLVMGENMLMMFVGWEGVGVCSYLLIGFWYSDVNNAEAGKKAFVVNRVGDFGFLLGMFLLYWTLEGRGDAVSLSFPALRDLITANPVSTGVATAVCLLLFVGATGKSAQIPLYVWLPDAMAGPTPVSALIHAATMVTAGVYMITRLNYLFILSPVAMTVVACVGAATALFAATIGLTQNDIKKVLAYSTVSQLGYMFMAVGLGAFSAGMFHLVTHAFFKACLFLGSGSVIHGMNGEQDMRKMGGLKKYMPKTYLTFLISTIAIAGLIPTSGFMSKDEILARALMADPNVTLVPGAVLYAVGALGALMTTFYMFRLVYMTFHGEFRGQASLAGGAHGHDDASHFDPAGDHAHGSTGQGHDDHGHGHGHAADDHGHGHGHGGLPHESPGSMVVPLYILAFLALFAGFLNVPEVLTGGKIPEYFHHWVGNVIVREPTWAHVDHGLELGLIAGLQVLIVLMILLAHNLYVKNPETPGRLAQSFGPLYKLSLNKYYVDEIYQALIVTPLYRISRAVLWPIVDAGIIDGLVNGVGRLVRGGSGLVGRLQTGVVNAYALSIVVGMVAILSYIALK